MLDTRRVALALTFLTSSSCALPITPIHSSGQSVAACLAVLAALFFGLLLLILLKRVYIQRRRANVSQMPQSSILSLPVGSTSAIVSVDSVTSESEKAGFIVGFFGSPSVEIQCALEKAEWKETKHSSFTYQIHTDSRHRRLDYPSVLDISRRHNRHASTSPRVLDKSPVLREPHSLNLPYFPDKAHVPFLPPRRFSLPTMNRSVAHDSQRRRHSSLKSTRGRRSVSFVPGSPSLRIVKSSTSLDTPQLPLSPQFSEVPMASPAPSSNSAFHPFSPKFTCRLSRSFMPPLPPLPFTNSPSNTTHRGGSIQISHPYALAPHPRKSPQTSSQTDLITTNTSFVPLELPALGPALSPTISSFPSPPPVTSILKPKFKVRARRSPAIGPIGPSPLRTMILPESVDCELSSYTQNRLNKENPDAMDRPISIHSPYTSLGVRVGELGGGSGTYAGVAKGASNNIVPKAKRRHSSVSSHRASKVEEDDPSVLLGIIRELVEETSEWDPSSVFMSQNFKTLLQESGITATQSAHRGFGLAEASKTEESYGFIESESDQSTRSAEVDLGLLGLDMFSSESFFDAGSYQDNSTNLVSFWDEDSVER
ncbi:hypothetical protein DFH09DRAFT_1356182 [Mycena vulgaris]|nr:hypothetical protein DFH09DRAFT_1356182 [Mycena vulgaris]